jgi:hypothetical protein
MNISAPIEKVSVYPDLLHNSENAENEFLNKISSNLDNIGFFENTKDSGNTYSSSESIVSKHIKQYIQIPNYNEVSCRTPVSLQVLQEWEGYVQEINDKDSTFTALLLDITENQQFPSEEADFRQEDIDEFDRHFLCNGAVFRWVIGYEGPISGTKKSVSKLIFRRLPKWNKGAIKRADKKAQQFKEGITWE